MSSALLSIVIVSFNTRELLRRCLASIVENPAHRLVEHPSARTAGSPLPPRSHSQQPIPMEVLVVDNTSTDGSAILVEREFPMVRLIRAGANLGFARATNLGLRESSGDLLLLLNPDTEVLGDALPTLAGFLDAHRRVAVAGPSLIYPDGKPQHAAFRFPNLWMSLFDFFPLNHRVIASRLNGRYRMPANGAPFAVDHPLGAAMLVKREALEGVGWLDESFFMYCEEIDWCIRAKSAGWQIYQVPSARVVHHAGQSTGQFREKMLVELHRSRYNLFRKHYSERFVSAHRAITRAGVAREMIRARWMALRGGLSSDELEKRLRAYSTIWSM